MYAPLNNPSAAVQGILQQLTGALASSGPDGLVLSPPGKVLANEVAIPPRLNDKLVAIRMLEAIPLSYMIPDAALLPPESIRFFFVDQTWIDRVTDGVLSAANAGSVDVSFSSGLNQLIRQNIDAQMTNKADAAVSELSGDPKVVSNWSPATQPTTGMLIRSDIVRRWPTMSVRAFKTTSASSAPIGVLRSEAISTGVYIALFAGVPGLVQIGEPHVGARFGVEAADPVHPEAGNYRVDLFDPSGIEKSKGTPPATVTVPVPLRAGTRRVIDIGKFGTAVMTALGTPAAPATSRIIAIELNRKPWVQDFLSDPANGITEASGIESPVADAQGTPKVVKLSNGRTLSSVARLAALQMRNT